MSISSIHARIASKHSSEFLQYISFIYIQFRKIHAFISHKKQGFSGGKHLGVNRRRIAYGKRERTGSRKRELLELNLYEHQSTFSPNMPLRDLFYIARELQKLMETDKLYRTKLVKIPTPRFLVLYNGTAEQPERQTLRLSDAFEKPVKIPELELTVIMLNINRGNNERILEQCGTLRDYMLYVQKVREYTKEQPVEAAVERAVKECIRDGILREFLTRHRKEAIMVSIFEYNEERALEYIREDEYAKGKTEGREEGIRILLELCGDLALPEEEAAARLAEKFHLSQQEAMEYMKRYWK